MIRRTWTKELVIEAIRDRHRSGLPLRTVWKEDRAFCCAAAKQFGSWQKALAAAGFQPYRTTWSRERIIDSIRAWHREGVALTKVWKADPTLYAYAKRFFGTWTKALLAARFKPRRRRWCRQSVIETLQAWDGDGLPLAALWQDHALSSAVHHYFGSRERALAAAGIAQKLRRRWSKPAIIDAIRERHARGLSMARTWKEDRALVHAGSRYFGSWPSALVAAGLKPNQRRWSAERVIQELQARFPDGQARGNTAKQDQSLTFTAKKYFGSWQDALLAAGIEPRQPKWSEARVIEAIQDGYVQGRPIEVAGFGDKCLEHGARRRFGNWPAAVAAAGLRDVYQRRRVGAGNSTSAQGAPHDP